VAVGVRAVFRAIAGLLHLLAVGLGGAVRAATGGAKDLDPAHRRDGIGLLLLVAALITAGGAWWQAGSAGDAISDGLRWAFGRGALLLPVLCLLGAWRVLRHPESKGGRGRLAIGWACLGLGALGVLHVVAGRPVERGDAGGLTGFLLGEPLANLLTPWLAVPVLLLLAGFGSWSSPPPRCTRCRPASPPCATRCCAAGRRTTTPPTSRTRLT
jgi:S-DNA-T family DNA segregation ATPase FtsK/SpoIIIE